MCYKEDLDEGKRPRIAAELLHGGFKDPFNYELLHIPVAQVPTIIDKNGERFPGPKPAAAEEDTEMRDAAVLPARRKAIVSIVGRGEFVAQFDPKYFQKAGFLYAIKKPMFKELKYKCQLVAACKKHGIKAFRY